MIKVEFNKYIDIATMDPKYEGYIKLDLSLFSSGVVAEMKPTNFAVLMAIVSHIDEYGHCVPSQAAIAKTCGISRSTVSRAINELMETTVNGQPIINRSVLSTNLGVASQYTLNESLIQAEGNVANQGSIETHDSTSTDISTDTSTDTSITFNNARDIANYFSSKYRDEFGSFPSINYGRELANVKRKWVGKYSDSQIKTMIDTAITEYDRWKSPKYQRPTLGALTSWLGEQALGLKTNDDKEFDEVQALTAGSEAMNNNALSRLQQRIGK